MKNIFNILIKPLVPIAVVLGMSACQNDLNLSPIDPNVDLSFKQDEVFNKLYATMALTGQQGPAGVGDVAGIDEGQSGFYRLIFTANEYPTDEAYCHWGDAGIPDFYQMNWGSSNIPLEGLYGRLNYDVVLCNHFLDNTNGSSDENTVRQRAEARFIRALNYFYLMDIFGNVPFSTSVSADLPQQIKREDLFVFIENEFLEILPDMYEPRQAPFGRADKAACWLMLARMYLNAEVYTGNARWSDAITYANYVIGSGYELCPNYKELFMADNDENERAKQEIILSIRQNGATTQSYSGSQFLICATHGDVMTAWGSNDSWSGVRARPTLVNKFFPASTPPLGFDEEQMVSAAGDDRALLFSGGDRTLEIPQGTGDFKNGFAVAKWTNVRSDGGATSHVTYADTDIPFLRLGEAYLILAEATYRNGGQKQDVLDALNELRDRAHVTRLADIASADVILDEWAREMYFEAHRRMDLVRFGYFTGNGYLWEWKGGIAEGTAVPSTYNVYPIPASDLNVNRNLVQNQGY
ncbi:MAG: RagB/SusD family nutrient uptake outer membrane protein [Culturomica sp.]|jgi:hypothetical protein|nr:RagB/SusD family nutrient uptake outer membrane protein [Culturomica sp.]